MVKMKLVEMNMKCKARVMLVFNDLDVKVTTLVAARLGAGAERTGPDSASDQSSVETEIVGFLDKLGVTGGGGITQVRLIV